MTTPKRDRVVIPVLIASGGSLSAAINLGGLELVGVAMPAAWDAANITFVGLSADGSTYGKVQNEAGTELTITSPAAQLYIALSQAVTGVVRGLGSIKVRSGTAALPVNQTANRTLWLVCLT